MNEQESQQHPNSAGQIDTSSRTPETEKPLGDPKACIFIVKFDKEGQVEVVDAFGPCKIALEESPPMKQAFWTRRLSEDVKKKLELIDKTESQ